MIEWIDSKTGDRVIRFDGRLLASRYDPFGEARAWLSSRHTFLDKVKTIFIIGAGCGYHILELARRTEAQMVVIDCHLELIEAVRPLLGECNSRIKWVLLDSVKELRANEVVRSAVAESFLVLEHPASISLSPERYSDCGRLLRGRDWGHLSWQWQLKGLPPLSEQTRLETVGDPLTIFDLEQCELVTNTEERERLLVLALRDLVK